jgi:hypothetical protein
MGLSRLLIGSAAAWTRWTLADQLTGNETRSRKNSLDTSRSRNYNTSVLRIDSSSKYFASDLLVLLRKTKRSISPDGTRRSSIFDDLSNISRKITVKNPTNLIPR